MSSVSEDTELAAWLRRIGGAMHAGVHMPHEFPGAGRGVLAAQACKRGDALIAVPPAGCLHVATDPLTAEHEAGATEVATWLRAQDAHLGPFLSTVLLLMAELARKEASPLRPWLSALPDSHDCVLAWTPEERAALQGTEISGTDASYPQVYEETLLPLMRQQPQWWPEAHRTYADFEFAAGMVQSRAFHLKKITWAAGGRTEEEQEDLYILAGIDMANHSTNAASRNATVNMLPADGPGAGTFVLTAERDIPAGEEVLYCYGALSDAELLRIYGFVEADVSNSHNFVSMTTASLMEACQDQLIARAEEDAAADEPPDTDAAATFAAAKEWVLQRVGSAFCLSSQALLPPELLTVVMVLLMSKAEFAEYAAPAQRDARSSSQSFPSLLDMGTLAATAQDDPDFCSDVCSVLLAALSKRVKLYAPAEAAAQAAGASASYRLQCAAQVRKGELAILSQASRWVVRLLNTLEEEDDGDPEDISGAEGGSSSDYDGEGSDEEQQPAMDRSAKRARTGAY